jgi:hypothetical protein
MEEQLHTISRPEMAAGVSSVSCNVLFTHGRKVPVPTQQETRANQNLCGHFKARIIS